jgi:hypothetical protein
MSTPAEIIRSHRDHLIRRLASRSRLLRFKPGKNGRMVDLHALFQGTVDLPIRADNAAQSAVCPSADDVLKALLGNAVGERPALARVGNPPKAVFGRCLTSARYNQDYYRRTGNWALYLGYPLLFWRSEPENTAKSPFWAPLFFWKINLAKGQSGKLLIWRPDSSNPEKRFDGNDEPEAPIFNRFLASVIHKQVGVNISLPDEKDGENFSRREVLKIVRDLLRDWKGCETQDLDEETRSFAEPASGAANAAVYPYAALGYGPFESQAILEDLENLTSKIKEAKNCGCMDLFVNPRSTKIDHDAAAPVEYGRIAVAESDPSQERAVWQAQKSRLIILQGPPGTGKSQTIVNLIAAALEREKRVAVICHQDAALNIVMKRLRARGLGNLAVKINKPNGYFGRFVDAIREFESDEGGWALGDNERRAVCEAIEKNENNADAVLNNICGKIGETPYGSLLAYLDEIKERASIDIRVPRHRPLIEHDEFQKIKNADDAKKKAKEIHDYYTLYKQCDYQNNRWREIKAHKPDSGDIRAILDELIDDCAGIPSHALHGDSEQWFVEHPLMVQHYPGLSEALSAQQKYAELFFKMRKEMSPFLSTAAIDDLCADYRRHGNTTALEECRTQLDSLVSLLLVKEKNKGRIIRLLHKHLKTPSEKWSDYFLAAAIYVLQKRRKLTPQDVSSVRQNIKDLKNQLERKQELDISRLLGRFVYKCNARVALEGKKLLKKRKTQRAPHKSSLRDIYHRGFEDITQIYPALLANPAAACQILPLKAGMLDLLIIDEASQVFTSDALSLLYRAKRVVISGDEMQMPPSDFFMLADDDLDDGEDAASEEDEPNANRLIPAEGEPGLLAAANHAIAAINAPNRKTLEVHYRSEAKELINFSNHAFYKGKLEAPPGNAPLPPFLSRPIVLRDVGGQFENGINRAEVAAVIDELKQIWTDKDAVHAYSVGVIVSNARQCDALSDALNEENGEFRTLYGKALNLERDGEFQGFFVRSIEHVQGDERDIIIFATTYDKKRRSFGPINTREKGRRRLNVAVTRAKRGMIVITSLDIDRISNAGEADAGDESKEAKERWFFWLYMRYARAVSEGNGDAINAVFAELGKYTESGDSAAPITGEPDNMFEESVADAIRQGGFHADYQIGESGFRIDIGVKRKPEDKIYLCGVECDGPTHRHWRARHRDIWRQDILESKGWKILRVWSTDWFGNKNAAKKKLLDKITALAGENAAD